MTYTVSRDGWKKDEERVRREVDAQLEMREKKRERVKIPLHFWT